MAAASTTLGPNKFGTSPPLAPDNKLYSRYHMMVYRYHSGKRRTNLRGPLWGCLLRRWPKRTGTSSTTAEATPGCRGRYCSWSVFPECTRIDPRNCHRSTICSRRVCKSDRCPSCRYRFSAWSNASFRCRCPVIPVEKSITISYAIIGLRKKKKKKKIRMHLAVFKRAQTLKHDAFYRAIRRDDVTFFKNVVFVFWELSLFCWIRHLRNIDVLSFEKACTKQNGILCLDMFSTCVFQ